MLFGNKNYFKSCWKAQEFIVNLIFPKRCIECGEYGSFICESCLSALKTVKKSNCPICRAPGSNGTLCGQCASDSGLDFLWVVGDYDDHAIKNIICKIKYNYVLDLTIAIDILAKKFFKEVDRIPKDILFVPIPLHRRRLLERGFNQASLISRSFLREVRARVDEQLLLRIKYNPPQAKLKAKERRDNLSGFFKINTEKSTFYNKESLIILVDDVFTTGTTMKECAKMLRKEGFMRVGGVVMATGN